MTITATQFAIIPEWLLDADINPRAVVLYGILRRYAGPGGCHPARKTLAERMKISEDTLDRLVKELVAIGALEVTPRLDPKGDRTSNDYALADAAHAFAGSPHRRGGVPASSRGTGPRVDAAVMRGSSLNEKELKPPSPSLALGDPGGEEDASFDAFWNAYPMRDGKRLERKRAVEQWLKLSRPERLTAMEAVGNYAASGVRPKDAYRWLRDRLFGEWLEPVEQEDEDGWSPAERRDLENGRLMIEDMKRQQARGPLR